MAILNRFEDPELERAYIVEERAKWRSALRALIVISLGIFITFALMNPLFFPAESLIIYNMVSFAMIVALLGGTADDLDDPVRFLHRLAAAGDLPPDQPVDGWLADHGIAGEAADPD